MRCPLPIDWLEYLDSGRGTEELTTHLGECRPCRLLVEELRDDAANREPLRLSDPPATQWPRWHESVTEFPAYGEIWWSARMLEGERRIPLLIASDPRSEYGDLWCEALPLSTDVENATALDLLLQAADTSLGVPWRALLRHQTTVRRQELDARIGRLTDAGRSLLDAVIAGRPPQERFGVPIADAYDDRLNLPEDVDRAVRLLGRAFAEASERDDAKTAQQGNLIFEFKRTRRPSVERGPMRLAANSAVSEQVSMWTVEVPRRGRIEGTIDYQWRKDELSFVIDGVAHEERGLQLKIWILVWSDLPEAIESEPFVPEVGRKIVLGRDRGVVPSKIKRLELRLSGDA